MHAAEQNRPDVARARAEWRENQPTLKTCLARFDNNKYSVNAGAVGRPVEIHGYADRIVIRQDGRIDT